MKRVRVILFLVAVVFTVSTAQAKVIQAGVSYGGGTQLELPGSKTIFTVPDGWSGKYDPQEKEFNMNGSASANLLIGYDGTRYEDEIAIAAKSVTTSDGIVMTVVGRKPFNQRISGEMFVYSGKALGIMNVTAVAAVIKTPEGMAVTISSLKVGMGQNIKLAVQQLNTVMNKVTSTIDFTSHPTLQAGRSPDGNMGRGTQGLQRSGGYGNNHNVNGMIAGIPVIARAEHRYPPLGPPDRVRIEKGDPFAGAFGNTSIPGDVDHKVRGLCLKNHWDTVALILENYSLVNRTNTRRVRFCSDGKDQSYHGRFRVDERKSANSKWHRADQGRYQMFGASPDLDDESSCDTSDLSVLFLDRVKGKSSSTLAQYSEKNGEDSRSYWMSHYSFGGEIYRTQGVNEDCKNVASAEKVLAACEKTARNSAEGLACRGKAFPEEYTADGSRKDTNNGGHRGLFSSGPGGQSVFGTHNGHVIIDTPNGGMMY